MSYDRTRSAFTSVERRHADRFVEQFINLLHAHITNNNITYITKP